MKVLMFGWELPPHNSGGLGVACYGLAKGLSHQGVGISFALPRRLASNISFMELLSHDLQGVEITAINSLLKAYARPEEYTQYLLNEHEEHFSMYAGSLYEEALRYADMAGAWSRYKEHQIIHAHDWMTYPAAIRAKRVSGKPFVAHIHATEYDRTNGNVNTLIADLEYQGLNRADRVIAVSNYTKEMVIKHYGVPRNNIDVVHNGVDLSEFQPLQIKQLFPKDKVVLFVGRLTYQKGVGYFLEAAKEVIAKRPDTIFLIVGHGDMYEELVMKAANLQIAHRVIFPGFLTGNQLKQCYQISDAFVMPSVSEPYGIVALEALAANTPTIITNQSGVSETLQNVLKVDYWDTHTMAQHIISVLNKPEFAQRMAKAALEEAALLTWDKAAQKTVQVYQHLI